MDAGKQSREGAKRRYKSSREYEDNYKHKAS